MMGGSYKALELNTKRVINMITRLAPNTHNRREGAVKPRRHVFVQKVGTEEHIMEFLKRYVGGERK